MSKKPLKDLRRNNTAQVLEIILREEQISRIEIAEKSSLSPSTVTQAVSLLIENGLVEEVRTGESTGGRRPILLQINPLFGCIMTVEIKRNGVNAQVFDMTGVLLSKHTLSKRQLCGNELLDAISVHIREVQENPKYPRRLIGIGLLCQDDIPEYDLMTEFSTSLSSDLIRLEAALATRHNLPVKKELINRYHLNYSLKSIEAECTDYAYINLGERITASFILNKKLVQNTDDSVFDLSSAVLSGNYAGTANASGDSPEALPPASLASKLTQVIKSALLFFPVSDIFIGGQAENLDSIVTAVSENFHGQPAIRKTQPAGRHMNNVFARQILMENYKTLVRA